MKQVTILQRVVFQYRAPFFLQLKEALQKDGIRLKVVYSDAPGHESRSKDKISLPLEFGVKVPAYWFMNNHFVYQHSPKELLEADLVICEQASKYVVQFPLVALSALHIKRFAFWGLGENKQSDRTILSEWLKRKFASKVTWWFAYTNGTAEYLLENQVKRDRITVVQNAVDTRWLRTTVESITEDELSTARNRLGIPAGATVGLYLGILDPVKCLDFLLDAGRQIRELAPDFHLVLAGAGVEEQRVRDAEAANSWIHYVGPAFGRDKALYCRLASAFLLPGRVGLAILDAFAGGLPLFATYLPHHGPEMEYLQPGVNGILTEHDVSTYVREVVPILTDPNALDRLREGAVRSAGLITIEAMVENFRSGVLKALELPVWTDRFQS
jgi:L-malate glycosyltransferase